MIMKISELIFKGYRLIDMQENYAILTKTGCPDVRVDRDGIVWGVVIL